MTCFASKILLLLSYVHLDLCTLTQLMTIKHQAIKKVVKALLAKHTELKAFRNWREDYIKITSEIGIILKGASSIKFLVSFQINFAKSQTYLVSTATC